jgi:hypothetical protein
MTGMTTSRGKLSFGGELLVSFTIENEYSFDSAYNTIDRPTGSFIDDDVQPGDKIEFEGNETNRGPFTVETVSALSLVVSEDLTDQSDLEATAIIWVEVKEINTMTTPQGEPGEIDMSHLKSTSAEFRNGLRDEGTITGTMNFVPDDRGQVILRTMATEQFPRRCRIEAPPVVEAVTQEPGYRWTFDALGRGVPANFSVNEKLDATYTLRVTGTPVEELIPAA